MDAFLAGLEQAKANGHDLSKMASVASFFVSRVDTEVDKRLEKLGEGASSRARPPSRTPAWPSRPTRRCSARERWTALAAAGAKPQRPLWASTGVKDPAYKDTMYVDDLIVNGVVNTMPEATLDAVADHGAIVADSVHGTYADAHAVLEALEAAGVSLRRRRAGAGGRGRARSSRRPGRTSSRSVQSELDRLR